MDKMQMMEERMKGQFPITISTSLALEGAFSILLDKPNPKIPPIQNYDELWINLRTLFRNLHDCFKKEQEVLIMPPDYAKVMREEMHIIQGALDQHTNGRVRAYFYTCSYQNLSGIFKHAQFKDAKTPAQIHYAAQENRTLEELDNLLKETGESFVKFDTVLSGHEKRTLIITHYPVDLLANQYMFDLALLESHTGAIKTKGMWHSKLAGGKDIHRIPFDIMTIQLFGDSGKIFTPYPLEFRKKMLEIAEQYQWTPATTKERIKLTVNLSRTPTLESAIMKLYATFL